MVFNHVLYIHELNLPSLLFAVYLQVKLFAVYLFSYCFWQLLWRPRPPSVLSPEKEEEIAKNLKKYSMKYKVEDQDVLMLLSEQDRDKRRMLKDEWDKWVNQWKHLHEVEKLERLELRDGEASDAEEEYEAKEVEVEEILDVSEEVLSFEE